MPMDEPAGSLVGIAQFAPDARELPNVVGRMAIDSRQCQP